MSHWNLLCLFPTAPCAVSFTGPHCKEFISCFCHGYYSHDGQRTWAKQELEAAIICFIRPTGIVEKQENNFLVNKCSQRIEIGLCRQIQSWLAVIYPQSAAVLLPMDCLGADWIKAKIQRLTYMYKSCHIPPWADACWTVANAEQKNQDGKVPSVQLLVLKSALLLIMEKFEKIFSCSETMRQINSLQIKFNFWASGPCISA